MDLAPFVQIATILATIVSMGLVLKGFRDLKNTKEEVFDYIEEFASKAFEFYAKEKADLIENGPKMLAGALHAPVMSQLGKLSGLSRSLKGAENMLVEEGISAATGNPALGALGAKILKRYPMLGSVLPLLGQNLKAGAIPQSNPGSDGVGYG